MRGKKAFTLGLMPALVISFVVLIIVIGISGTILSDIRDTQTSGDADYNASSKGLTGIKNIANWAPTIGTIMGAVLIIGLVGYFAFRTGK